MFSKRTTVEKEKKTFHLSHHYRYDGLVLSSVLVKTVFKALSGATSCQTGVTVAMRCDESSINQVGTREDEALHYNGP